jgi:pimeloyl-ACP methyl ester carboxylesterase
MMIQEKFVNIGENKIRFLEYGQSNDDIIVLVHGLGASAERWEKVIPYLDKKYHLIIPDVIGFGYSDKPNVDYTVEFFVNFLADFLKVMGIKKTAIIASSLGGHIAAECAINQNKSIQKIILVAPSGINSRLTPAMDAYALAMLYPNQQRTHAAFKMMAGPDKDIDPHTIKDFVNKMRMPNVKMVFTSVLLGLKNTAPLTDRLHKISIPTMIVWGSHDSVIPPRYAKILVSNIKRCQFVKMKGCGHTPFTEEPEKHLLLEHPWYLFLIAVFL